MNRLVLAVGLWILGPPAYAGGTEGAVPLNFLFLDADARPVALGGAYAAVAADANSLLYNPAGLAVLKQNEAAFMHAEHFQGVGQEYAAVAIKGPVGPLSKDSGLGFMVNTVGYGRVPRTTISNPRGSGLDGFGIRDWALAAGYGRKLGWDWLAAGAAVKYLREDIDTFSAQAVAVDLGLRTDLAPAGLPVSAAVALQNVGTKLRYQSSREDLPANLKVGIAVRPFQSALLAFDVNQPRNGEMTVHAGAEYVFVDAFAVRLGYNGRNDADSGITVGGGVGFGRFAVNYAFVPFGGLGNSHRISLAYRW